MVGSRITVVVNDQARGDKLVPEHGLAVWIETGGEFILFDTGQGPAIASNAAALGIPLEKTNAIVLSHGHYDHTGGVSLVLGKAGKAVVYIHPLGFESKYARGNGTTPRRICMPDPVASDLLERNFELSCVSAPTRVGPGVYVTGEIPRRTGFEQEDGSFFLDENCAHPDRLKDDQALYLESPRGTVVVLGCAHSGVVNTLDYISKLTHRAPIHAVLGGMHLLHATQERIDRTADALIRYRVEVVAPCHCTGAPAISRLRERLGDRVVECGAGTIFEFATAVITITQDIHRDHY
jgi:7,8-dihydropterin-6-yl-methyl-4-(beta-D-ribofuranosyl)aminobenzene 5'-phosphate synthase